MKLDAKLSTIELEYRSDPLNRLSTTEPLRLLSTDTKYLEPESRKPLRQARVRTSQSKGYEQAYDSSVALDLRFWPRRCRFVDRR